MQTRELVLSSDVPATLTRVHVAFNETHTSGGVQVSTRGGDTSNGTATWSVVRYCDATGKTELDCAFSPRETSSAQILISTNGSEIRELSVGSE